MANTPHSSSSAIRRSIQWLPWLVLFIFLTFTYLLWQGSRNQVARQTHDHFDFRVREVHELIINRMLAYEQVLRGVQGLFDTGRPVTRADFESYVAALQIADLYPGIQGVGYSVIVPAAQKDQHIAELRQQGFSDYTIRPEGARELYTSIIYLEPFAARNLRAFGFDMYSESVRREAMARARDTGRAILSGKVKLVQETNEKVQAGFLMYLPVYKKDLPLDTIDQRREAILGWAYAPFRMDDLMAGLQGERKVDLRIRIHDGTDISDQSRMYDSRDDIDPGDRAGFSESMQLEINGHTWTVLIKALPGFDARINQRLPLIVLIAGLILSVLLTLVVWFLVYGRQRALAMAAKMTGELTQKEERLTQVIQATRVGIWEWNVVTGAVVFNERWAGIAGYRLAELLPVSIKTWEEMAHPEDLKRSEEALKKVFAREERYYNIDCRIRHRDGNWIWVQDQGTVIEWTVDGKPLRMVGTHTDITERKIAAEALHLANIYNRSLIEASLDPLVIIGFDGKITDVNSATEKSTGYPREKLIGTDFADYFVDPQRARAGYQKVFHDGNVSDYELNLRHRDGGSRSVVYNASIYRDVSGNIIGIFATTHDITERKRIEEELKVSELRFRELVASVTDYMYTVRLDGQRVVSTVHGRGCITVTGYSAEEYARDPALWFRMVHDEDKIFIGNTARQLISGRDVPPFEHRIIHKDGSVRWVRHTPVIRRDEAEFLGYDGLISDITERKQMEEALRVAKEQAEAANQAKSEFLLNISHDVRTPLNSILGLSSVLTAVPMDEKYKKCVAIIQREGKGLLALVEDILQISKLESGRLGLRSDELDLAEIATRLVEGARLELGPKDVRLSVVMEPMPRLKGDSLRVSQIFSNILSNAVKYTEKGEIRVTLTGGADYRDKRYYVKFSVKDTGFGIPPDKLPAIFDPFTRFHEFHGGKTYKGVGLGLNIVKTLVELMHGDIRVSSEIGKGSEFVITLNFEQI